MTRAHQHATVLGHERKDVAGPHEIAGAAVAVGERAHRVAALLGGNPGVETVPHVDRHRESRAERRVIGGDHGIEVQALGVLRRQGRADDAGGMADDEGHFLRRAQRRRHEQVALVLAVVVVGDHDDLAAGERGHQLLHAVIVVGHDCPPSLPDRAKGHGGGSPICPR